MTIFEIAIETRFAAAEACGGVGCVLYGMFDDDMAPEYGRSVPVVPAAGVQH